MIPFITYREPDLLGNAQYYILQKAHPNIIGILVTMPKPEAIVNQPIAAYRLWVSFHGTLRENMIPAQSDIYNEIESVVSNMADWFYQERILKDNKRFKKWKL